MVTSADANRVLSDLAASAADGFHRARNDAADAAERTLPLIRRSLAKTTYTLAYFAGFGAVYTATVIGEMLPADGFVRQGLRDGAAAAREAHATRHVARHHRHEERSADPAVPAVPTAP
jgi:hypothetical protein